MEVDYYQVLGFLSKLLCTKKGISEAYLRAVRERPSPEKLALLDRALLVLRISYLRYVYERRGEAGLREQRSAETITRGMKAIAITRSMISVVRQRTARSSNRSSSSSSSTSSSCTSSSSSSTSSDSHSRDSVSSEQIDVTSNEQASSHKVSNQQASSHKASNQRTSSHKASNQRTSSHKASNQRASSHKASNQRASSHKVSNQRALSHVASKQASSHAVSSQRASSRVSRRGDGYKLSSLSSQQLEEQDISVTTWLDEAWKSGMMLPRASSSLKSRATRSPSRGEVDARKRGDGDPNKPAIATELFPRYPSPIPARECWGDERQDAADDRHYSTRYFITRPHYCSTSSNRIRSTSMAAESIERPSFVPRREHCLAPPRPILGGRRSYLQRGSLSMPLRREHPYSRRRPAEAGGSPHQGHRYHLERPLVHMTKTTPTCTMRVIIQK